VKHHPVTSATVARVRIDDERGGRRHHQYRHISNRGYPPPLAGSIGKEVRVFLLLFFLLVYIKKIKKKVNHIVAGVHLFTQA
jgi:hypothetical protein